MSWSARHFQTFIFLFSLSCMAGWGCRMSPRTISIGGSSAARGMQNPASSGPPVEVLNRVDTHLQQQGYSRLGPAIRNADMPTGGLVAYTIDAKPAFCYLAIAISASANDLDMALLDPAGRTVAHDVRPDAHPWASVCPPAAGPYVARLQMARGSGEYYYAVYQGKPQSDPQLAAFFGGAQAGPQTAEIDDETAQRVRALAATLKKDRFEQIDAARGIVLAARQDRNFPLNLQHGSCYAFATFGGAGVQDTDVFIVDGSGNELQRDATQGRDAQVRFCPPSTGVYTLRTRLYDGGGPVFYAGWVQEGEGASSRSAVPIIAAGSTMGVGLEENFRLLDADMQARGYRRFGNTSRGELGERQVRDFRVRLEGGKCYAILAVGDTGVRDLDLILASSRGQQLDRDVESDARPIVRVCASKSGQYQIKVSMAQGSGKFVYAAYRWPRGTRGPFGLSGLIYVRLAEVTSLLSVEGFEPDANFSPGKGSLASQGRSAQHSFKLPAGQCYSVLAVGGDGLSDMDLTLSRNGKQLASDGTRNGFPSVRYCSKEETDYQLQVTATGGSGEYFYQVFRRK